MSGLPIGGGRLRPNELFELIFGPAICAAFDFGFSISDDAFDGQEVAVAGELPLEKLVYQLAEEGPWRCCFWCAQWSVGRS